MEASGQHPLQREFADEYRHGKLPSKMLEAMETIALH
jgi:hypothetical protein